MERWLDDMMPILGVEHDCLLSRQGDITIVFEAELPELFTLSDRDYEAFHQAMIKAIKVLPKFSVFHKQDWFFQTSYQADFHKEGLTTLSRSSERFFNERPFLDHRCFIYLTKKPAGRKATTSLFSSLIRRSIAPEQTLKPQLLQDFLDSCGQFAQILGDSGFIRLNRLREGSLLSTGIHTGLVEQYLYLLHPNEKPVVQDVVYGDTIQVGKSHCQLYTLSDVQDLPGLCGSRINYDRYSTDKTKFSVGLPHL